MQKRKLSIFLSIDICYNRIEFVNPDTLAMRGAKYRDFFVCTLLDNRADITEIVVQPPIILVVFVEKYG